MFKLIRLDLSVSVAYMAICDNVTDLRFSLALLCAVCLRWLSTAVGICLLAGFVLVDWLAISSSGWVAGYTIT